MDLLSSEISEILWSSCNVLSNGEPDKDLFGCLLRSNFFKPFSKNDIFLCGVESSVCDLLPGELFGVDGNAPCSLCLAEEDDVGLSNNEVNGDVVFCRSYVPATARNMVSREDLTIARSKVSL